MSSRREDRLFKLGPAARHRRCAGKDAVTVPVLESVVVRSPKTFYALLMPCYSGPELEVLARKGVPKSNIWGIEKDLATFRCMRRRLGINMLHDALSSDKSIVHVASIMAEMGARFGLIYLDYFGQPHAEHVRVLRHIFLRKMLAESGILLLTFGKNRSHRYVARINQKLSTSVPVRHYVDTVLRQCRKKDPSVSPYKTLREFRYKSRQGPSEHEYVLTEVKF